MARENMVGEEETGAIERKFGGEGEDFPSFLLKLRRSGGVKRGINVGAE